MTIRIALQAAACAWLALAAAPLAARVTPEEAARLGAELTPVGAEQAGNADGTIPAWAPIQQHGALKGEYPRDPVLDAEKPLFTITKANLPQYERFLTEGHKHLLAAFDSYKMNVYPTHRMVTWPAEIAAATRENAVNATLTGTDEIDGARLGFPFPIPRSGAEVIWNHKLKWRGESVRRYNNQLIVQPGGQFQLTKIVEDVKFYYASIRDPHPLTRSDGMFIKYLSETVAPPRMAGTFILVHEKGGTERAAWLYSPGLRRIRRAPNVCCDNPYEGTDGHQFYDQVDMFNGVLERYDWKLLGKREMFIGYHGNRLASDAVTFKEMAAPRHLNPDLPRYEKHRVWVVEATLRPGTNHTFKKRVMYVDEDGWNIVAVDNYDSRGQLYQFQEGHYVLAPNILSGGTVPEVIYHFDSGRYFITAAANEDKPNDFTVEFNDSYFEAAGVQKRTTK